MRFDLPVVAITGSNGKTTTKDLTAAVLSARGPVQKTQANFNNEIGLPMTLLGIEEKHTAAVVEIGMRGLHQIEALAPLAAPTVGIVPNVGETHMELLGSLENIAKAKAELVEAIPAGGTVILNNDNPYVAGMKDKAQKGVKVITFGIEQPADVKAEAIRTENGQTIFMVEYGNERHEYILPMVGRHNVENALAAISAGFALGMKAEKIREGLLNLEATKMRFECQEVGPWHVVNDAYNASPMSMKAAIETLSELVKEGRKIAVMGDMLELGEVEEEAHRQVGRELSQHGFAAVVTRGKLGALIAEGAKETGIAEAYTCESHEEAAARLKEILQPGDTVLFKGSRGMAMEKIIDLLK
jgi:UDP-N-acetylmuramoyl-tripeptide--D-alanyl-D-alanine ligase/murE/murF fusion protein